MRDEMMSTMLRLVCCPGKYDAQNPEAACVHCPCAGDAGCREKLKVASIKHLQRYELNLQGRETPQTSCTTKLSGRITQVLHELGMPAHLRGYDQARLAIELAVHDSSILHAVTTKLYPQVARAFGTTSSRVERAIRHAVEVAWDRGDIDTLQHYFGYTVSNTKGKPTNSEFIALIADKLRLELELELEKEEK